MHSSPAHLAGPVPGPMPDRTLCSHLFDGEGPLAPELEPMGPLERPWLVVRRGREATPFSRAQVARRAAAWAGRMVEAGVGEGDRVALLLPNGVDFVAALFGVQRLGAVPVPLPWPFFLDRVDRHLASLTAVLERSTPRVMVTTARVAELDGVDLPRLTEPGEVPHSGPDLSHPERAAFIQFTSGTTAGPKGAVISHRAAVASALGMGRALALGPHDVGVSWLPLFHDMGLVGALFCSLAFDFPLHLMSPSEFMVHPRRWLEAITEARGTVTVAPNFAFAHATRRVRGLEGLELSSLRVALNGSEPVTRTVIEGFEGRFSAVGVRPGVVLPVYGLAENTLGVCFSPLEPAESGPAPEGPVPVGTPLEGVEVDVRDPETGGPTDGEGEIWVRGPALMDGYFGDPEATAATLSDGWLRTGDLGFARAGQLHVTGRKKELVIKAGRKFPPEAIEGVVREALDDEPTGIAALSVRGEDTESLVVFVETRTPGNEQLERRLRGRVQEALGVRADTIRFVRPGALPRTTSGKVRRRACADLLEPRS